MFLCKSDDQFKNCGEREATAEQRLTIERTLRGLPEVSAVRFESRVEALREFQKSLGLDSRLRYAFRESDMSESFRVKLKTTADFRRKVEDLPGVSNVFVYGTSFWADKTDVVVELCPLDPLERDKRCHARGAAGVSEKTALYKALRAVDGVDAIYLEDRGHAWKNASWRVYTKPPDTTKLPGYIPESFHLVLDAPDAADRVRRAVGELPGVNTVEDEPS